MDIIGYNYYIISRSEGLYSCASINLQPENNGTWVSLDLLDSHYRSADSWRHMETKPDSGIMNLYIASDFVDGILDAYQLFYGTYNYGFSWEPISNPKDSKNYTRSKWRSGPFVVSMVNNKEFPELTEISKGDLITGINRVSTKNMNYNDLLLKLMCTGKEVLFNLQDATGKQKQITVTPKFVPASTKRKNFIEIINKDSEQFVEFNDYYYPLVIPRGTYNPLGNGAE